MILIKDRVYNAFGHLINRKKQIEKTVLPSRLHTSMYAIDSRKELKEINKFLRVYNKHNTRDSVRHA